MKDNEAADRVAKEAIGIPGMTTVRLLPNIRMLENSNGKGSGKPILLS